MTKKIAIIMGRGIEGCGVTKYTVEQVKWLRSHGYETKVYTSKDKTFARKDSHDLGEVDAFKFADTSQIDRFINECNNFDYIFINSLPALGNGRGAGVGDTAIYNWVKALKSFNKPIILIQHDHMIHSIKRNAAIDEAISVASLIFAHSSNNDFSDYIRKNINSSSLMSFFGEETVTKKIFNFQPGLDFELNRKNYWKPISEQDALHHKWIGRCTSWKGYDLMIDWNSKYLSKENYLTTLEGIEKSPAFIAFKEQFKFFNHVLDKPETIDLSERYGNNEVTVFGTYKNSEMLHRMSRVGFGYQLSVLKPKYIEKSIEYTHCEVASVGTVPVFNKEYGDVCIHRVTGDPLSKSKDNFTIWLSKEKSDMEVAINKIKKLAADPILRDEWREGAYAFYKAHQDSEYVFKDLMKYVKDNV